MEYRRDIVVHQRKFRKVSSPHFTIGAVFHYEGTGDPAGLRGLADGEPRGDVERHVGAEQETDSGRSDGVALEEFRLGPPFGRGGVAGFPGGEVVQRSGDGAALFLLGGKRQRGCAAHEAARGQRAKGERLIEMLGAPGEQPFGKLEADCPVIRLPGAVAELLGIVRKVE